MSETKNELLEANRMDVFKRFWQRLVEPHPALTDISSRRQAQLLAALSLVLALFFGFGTLSRFLTRAEDTLLLIGTIAMIGVYVLSRTRYYQTGAILIVLFIAGSAYLDILVGSDDPSGALYSFIPLALILGSVLLPLPWMITIVVGTSLINFLLPILNPSIEMREIVAAAGILVSQGALFIVVIVFRNSLERGRLLELTNANEELRQASLEVQQSTQRVRAMFTALPDGIGVTDPSGLFLETNQSMAQLAGLDDPAQLVGRNAAEFIAPTDQERAVQDFASGAAVESSIEYRMVTDDGHEFDGELTTAALTDEQDQPTGYVVVARDITAQKQAQQERQVSEERLRAIYEGTSDAIMLLTPEGFFDCNPQSLELFGFESVEEFTKIHPADISPPHQPDGQESFPAAQERIQTAYEQGHNRFDWVHRRTNGEDFPAEVLLSAFELRGETVLQATVRDISDRKQMEQELKEEQERLQTILESISVPIIISRLSDSKVLYANRALAEVSHIDLDMLTGGRTEDYFVNPDDRDKVMEELGQQGYVDAFETQLRRGDGEIYWALLSAHILNYQNEVCVFTSYSDITAFKEMEREIQSAFERRGRQVQLSTRVSQSIATASSLDDLNERVVTEVKEQFGYYHTQILRYATSQNAVVLVTGYGETGAEMLTTGHQIPLGSGLIGTAAKTGETVLRSDLAADPDWQPNPLLPDTRGEIAVPIKLGDEVLGVLDVQSDQVDALTEDDQLLLEGLCGQIAIAIEQTRLRQEMAERLDEINRLYRTMSRESWRGHSASSAFQSGLHYDQSGIHPLETEISSQSMYAMPLTAPGGAVIGTLAIDNPGENPLNPDEEVFLQQVSEQVALALDSARLFEQAQTRSEELDILNEMGRTLTSLQDEQAIYETIYEYTGKLMDVSSFHIAIYHQDKQEYSLPVITEQGQRIEMPNQPAGNGLTDYIIKTRQPLLFKTDVDAQARALGIDPIIVGDDLPTLSWLGVPLIFKDRTIGVVAVQSDTTPRMYTEHERDMLTAIASQAAIALENASAFQQTQQQAEREAMINLISQRIQSTTSVESALQVAIRELGRALSAKRANVQLGSPTQQRIKQ